MPGLRKDYEPKSSRWSRFKESTQEGRGQFFPESLEFSCGGEKFTEQVISSKYLKTGISGGHGGPERLRVKRNG